MAGFYGGDTEQLRQHAQACTHGAQRLSDLVTLAQSAIDGAVWEGPDADAFRERWQGTVMPSMLARGEDVHQRARELEQHADQQDEASGVGDGGPLGPLLPLPAFPGSPLGPGIIGGLGDALGGWFSGGGATGPQEFYGDPGYGDRGQMFGMDRPVGHGFDMNPTLWDGREIEKEAGYVDVHAGANYSAGMNGSTDEYGNMTGTVGARGSLEAGVDSHLNLPGGFGMDASTSVGMEAYAEAGGTVGPDGYSIGARAGSGLYAEQSAALTHESGASVGASQSYYVGAEAHANAYNHVTRNDEGQVNGFTSGFNAGAFAGAAVTQDFEATSPGGWFSVSGGATAAAGAGADANAGYTVSTDEISFSAGGKVAAELGLGGFGDVSMNPNAIVDSFTPGDYDVDDAIGDAQGAFDGATSAAGDALGTLNPFG